MSLDLGTVGWSYVGIVDGFALLRHIGKSRWIDLRTWPGKLLQIRPEDAYAVCPGATLAGNNKALVVYTWKAPDKARTEIRIRQRVYRAIGSLRGKICLVGPDAIVLDDGWKLLDAVPGDDDAACAIVGELVVWRGRVFHHANDRLVETHAGDLPPGATSFCGDNETMYCVADGKLVIVRRHGKDRDDRKIGTIRLFRVMHYDGALLVSDGRNVWRYDVESRSHEPFDIVRHDALIAAPCGLVALVRTGRELVRARV